MSFLLTNSPKTKILNVLSEKIKDTYKQIHILVTEIYEILQFLL